MLDANTGRVDAVTLQAQRKGPADRDYQSRAAQRPPVELVVELILEISGGVSVVERDPRQRAVQTEQPHKEMRFDVVALEDIRTCFRDRLFQDIENTGIEAASLMDRGDLDA